jgi:hypothetical protein
LNRRRFHLPHFGHKTSLFFQFAPFADVQKKPKFVRKWPIFRGFGQVFVIIARFFDFSEIMGIQVLLVSKLCH